MSRRLVSVCILALAGITSFSAACAGNGKRHASPLKTPLRNSAPNRNGFTLDRGKNEMSALAVTGHCGQRARCAAPFMIPMTFEPNAGQFDARVQFAGRGEGMTLLLTRSGMDVVAPDPGARAGGKRIGVVRMRVGWTGAKGKRENGDARFAWSGEARVKAVSNYFMGKNPHDWHTNVPHFARVQGISGEGGRLRVMVYGTAEGIEYDLRLAPGEDASKLRIRFSGPARVALSNRSVVLRLGKQQLRMDRPRIFSELPGGIREVVHGKYVIEADGSVGLRIGRHNPRAALVVDPSLTVAYATFLGGAGSETAGNVAIDANGKAYVSGVTTSSTTFPEAKASTIGPVLGASAFYVAKIDPTVTGANSLIYLTFLGGSGTQSGGLIALDGAGDVALTGTTTSTDYPVTGSSQPTVGLTSGSGNDAVVSEINGQGNQLNFSAYFGGSGFVSANGPGGIAVDRAGNVYIASDVQPSSSDPASPDLPVTAGAFQPAWDGMESDGFLAVFAPPSQTAGAPTLTYCTYLGTNSAGQVGVGGVAVDSDGNAYVGGSTSNASNGFPVQNAFQAAYGGGTSDGFVMKIAPKGQGAGDLIYATLLGGSGADEVLAIALDSSLAPKAYVTGATQSSDFPVTSATAYQTKLHASPIISGSANAFVAVIAQDAVSGQASLAYSSYLGGSDTDSGNAIAVAAPGSVYVAGETDSFDFPWHDNIQPFNAGDANADTDAFLANFNTTASGAASLVYSTLLGGTSSPGGTGSSAATGVAANGAGQVYVTGETTSADFPTAITTSGAALNGFQQNCASCQDATPGGSAFVLGLSENSSSNPSVYFSSASVAFGAQTLGSRLSQPAALVNGGEQTLTVSDIEVLGPNASDFTVQTGPGCIQVPIAPFVPGSTPQCSMEIGFAPSIGGPEQAFLEVTDDAPGSPQLLELKGTGEAPHAQVLPANLSFGDQPLNTVSPTQAIAITNTGTEALTISSTSFSPSPTPFSSQDDTCHNQPTPWVLAPQANCTLQIAFAPVATGVAQGRLQISDNSDSQSNAQQVVTFTANGVPAAPLAQILPATLTFGNTLLGSASAPQSVTLQNTGSAALDISAIAIGGTNATDFEIASAGTTCPTTGGSVAIGGQCTVAVQFAPQSPGASKSATLNFTDNAPGSPQSAALNGVASSPATLTVSPSNLSFGSQSEGTTSAAQTVSITNSGSGDASISGIAIAGSTDFTQQNPCSPVLPSGQTCQVSVIFSPAESAAPGSRSGTLKIPGATPAIVTLSGIATQSAIFFTTSLSFASQLVGTKGAPQPITIANSASGPLAGTLEFGGISIGGTNKSDFSITADQCSSGGGAGVPPGNSCTVQVAFQPLSPQPPATCGDEPNRSASLQLQDNAPGSPQSIPLSGTATDFCLATANGQPVTTPIQPGQAASYSLEIASAGGFSGAVSLSCSVTPGGAEIGPCTITTNPSSNPPTVQVTPSAAGQFTLSVPTLAPSALLTPGPPPGSGSHGRSAAAEFAWLACLLLLAAAMSRARRGALSSRARRPIGFMAIAALAAALTVAAVGCGSGGGNSDPAPISGGTSAGTPAGTYTITVTASTTSNGISVQRTSTLTFCVEVCSAD